MKLSGLTILLALPMLALVYLIWAVPAAYSAVAAEDEVDQVCPADASSCPLSKQNADADA